MRWLAFLFTLSSLPALALELDYVASYRGLLSAGAPLDIADVHLSLPETGDAPARLRVTTAPYAKVEWIYPLRFDYRAWLTQGQEPQTRQVAWSKTDRKGTQIRRLCFQCEPGRILVSDIGDGGPMPVGLVRDWSSPDRRIPWDASPMDRMAMLQRLRRVRLSPGRSWSWAVSNGSGLQGYRIEIGTPASLRLGKTTRDAIPVDLIPIKERPQRDRRIRMWLSEDPGRIPLLFSTQRALGEFRVALRPGR